MEYSPVEADSEYSPALELMADAAPLAKAVDYLARRIVERRNTIPILGAILFEIVAPTRLRLRATDLDIFAEVDLDIEVGIEGAFAVDAYAMRDVLKKAAESYVIIRQLPDRDAVEVSSGRARHNVKTLPVADFPARRGVQPDAADLAFGPDHRRQLELLAPFASREETRYYLNGIAIQRRELSGDKLVMAATDGKELSAYALPFPDSAGDFDTAIVRSKAVAAALWAMKAHKGDSVAWRLDRTDMETLRFAEFHIGGFRIASKLIDGTYPDFGHILDAGQWRETDAVLFPQLAPDICPDKAAKVEKAVKQPVIWRAGQTMSYAVSPADPDWICVSCNSTGKHSTGPWTYGYGSGVHAFALDYARKIAARDGRRTDMPADTCHRGPYIVGVTFGEKISPDEYRVDENTGKVGALRDYETGAYSIVFPRCDRPVTAEITVEVEGKTYPVRHSARGAIELSKESVRRICGPVDPATHIEIPRRQYFHGRLIPDCYIVPPPPTMRPETADEMAEYARLCRPISEFEHRVRLAMDGGGLDRDEAEAEARGVMGARAAWSQALPPYDPAAPINAPFPGLIGGAIAPEEPVAKDGDETGFECAAPVESAGAPEEPDEEPGEERDEEPVAADEAAEGEGADTPLPRLNALAGIEAELRAMREEIAGLREELAKRPARRLPPVRLLATAGRPAIAGFIPAAMAQRTQAGRLAA